MKETLKIEDLKVGDEVEFNYIADGDSYGRYKIKVFKKDGEAIYSAASVRSTEGRWPGFRFPIKYIQDLKFINKTPESFESQLARAKALIGKMVQFKSCSGIVDRVEVFTEFGKSNDEFWDDDSTKEVFGANGGWVIAVQAQKNDTGDELPAINIIQNVSEIKDEWKSISVNGYKAELMTGRCWKFGCAVIHFDQILVAAKLTEKLDQCGSNREMTSIKFGAGEFSAEQIKTLAKYSV